MAVLRVLIRVISFVKIAVLARLLNPTQFGLFGIASVTLVFLEIVTEVGIIPLLVQEKEGLKKYLNSVWVVSIFRGILIFLLLLIIAKPVSLFFNSPESYDLLLLVSIVPLLRGLINPSVVSFQKNLAFSKEFIFRFTISFIDFSVSLTLVYLMGSVIGLIWGLIIATVIEVLISWLFIKPLPKFDFKFHKLSKVIHRGKYITLSGIFNYLFHNIDDIFVGRIIGTTALGLYQVAYKISTIPIIEGGEIVSKVVFPVYVKISGNSERLKKAFIKVILSMSIIIIPISFLLIMFTEHFVILFLGKNWLDIVPILKVLVIFGSIRAISGSSSALFLAVKKQEYITIVTFVSLIGILLVLFPLLRAYGIIGAAYASLFGALLAVPFMYIFTVKVFNEKS